MKIGGNEYFYDVARQKYVMFLDETQEVKVIEKEHLKLTLFNEFLTSERGETLVSFGDEKALLKEFGEFERTKKIRIELVYLEFAPHRPIQFQLNGFSYRNTYIPSDIVAHGIETRKTDGLLALRNDFTFLENYPFIDRLLNNLFVDFDRKKYFLNWLSCALVTRKKNRTAIVLKGIQGSGKGVLWEQIIEYAIGKNYCATISNDDLKSQFNDKLENKLFILANEIQGDFRDGNTSYEKLKMYITDSELRLEQKKIDARRVENYFNVLISSNNTTPLQIQGSDRRYTVYETSSRKLKDIAQNDCGITIAQFIDKVQEERDAFISDLLLYNYDVELASTAQQTDEKHRIYRASMTKHEILADKLKELDAEFFLNDFAEIAETMKAEEFFNLCKERKVVSINDEIQMTVEHLISNMFTDIELHERAENAHLQFLFEVFTSDRSATKIGTILSSHFGQSKTIRSGDVVKRYRTVKPYEQSGGVF